jgi:hypothetical protein
MKKWELFEYAVGYRARLAAIRIQGSHITVGVVAGKTPIRKLIGTTRPGQGRGRRLRRDRKENQRKTQGTNVRLPPQMIFLLRFEKAIYFGRS